jgi:glycerol-3-phosphate dehydrogenase (NAD(P)+)
MSDGTRIFTRAAVIGAGAWGTTLAWLMGGQGRPVTLWARPEQAAAIARDRENRLRLPGVRLPDAVAVCGDLPGAVAGADLIIVAVPSEHLRATVRGLRGCLGPGTVIMSATKGLEVATGKRMSEVLVEELEVEPSRVVALSGPNLSGEIVAGQPAVSAVAGRDEAVVQRCQKFVGTPLFRIYANYDILGVETCGALKNVLALAAGVSDGLGFGANARAALVTRGLAEMGRVGTALGALRATFWGVAGIGDVLATCNSRLSRNWQAGYRLAQGEGLQSITGGGAPVVEGVPTTAAARALADRLGVDAPITGALYQVLFEGHAPRDAVRDLMARPERAEAEGWQ